MMHKMMHKQFVSYPKSGRTWIRFILSRLDFEHSIQFHHDRFEFNDGSRPAHDFDLSARLKCYAKVEKLIYLERDPRDVMVSLYYQVMGRFGDFFDCRGSLSEFIRDDYFGAVNLKKFRDMWEVITERRGFPTISYEACHGDMNGVLQHVLSYYEFKVLEPRLSDAIRMGSFEKMREVEASMEFAQPWLRYRNNSPKVREGKVGGFRAVLSEPDVEYLNKVFELRS